jgi:hypothetical protein
MKFDLSTILGNSSDQIMDQEVLESELLDEPEKHAPLGYCVECGGSHYISDYRSTFDGTL